MTDNCPQSPIAVARILRTEGLFLATAATAAFWLTEGSWWLFAALILAPDVSMLGYLVGRRAGALAYNIGHSTVIPITLALVGMLAGAPLAVHLALIWLAHIGLDRAIGYGLKYPHGFSDTHLGRV
jgi:hypothetical protein